MSRNFNSIMKVPQVLYNFPNIYLNHCNNKFHFSNFLFYSSSSTQFPHSWSNHLPLPITPFVESQIRKTLKISLQMCCHFHVDGCVIAGFTGIWGGQVQIWVLVWCFTSIERYDRLIGVVSPAESYLPLWASCEQTKDVLQITARMNLSENSPPTLPCGDSVYLAVRFWLWKLACVARLTIIEP